MDDDKFQLIIKTKCNLCFRRNALVDGCLLYKEKHAGLDMCLGPFRDQEDRMRKIREDFAHEEKHADLDRAAWEVVLNRYLRNKKLFDD